MPTGENKNLYYYRQQILLWLQPVIEDFHHFQTVLDKYRYLKAVSLPFVGLLAMTLLSTKAPVANMGMQWLLLPLAFALWLSIIERQNDKIYRPFSLGFAYISLIGFMAVGFTKQPTISLAIGVIAGIFVVVSPVQCALEIMRNLRLTAVMMIAASAWRGYHLAQSLLWKKMCHAVADTVRYILHDLAGLNVWVHEQRWRRVGVSHRGDQSFETSSTDYYVIYVKSKHFGINLYPQCSGLEGIFLFLFLLSTMIMLNWSFFRRQYLSLILLIVLPYMYVMNTLRIASFFALGYWAYQPGASDFARSMRNTPVKLFHEWSGWFIYLFAFAFFMWCVYTVLTYSQKLRGTPK